MKVKINIMLVFSRKQKKSKHLYTPNGSGFLFTKDILGSPLVLVVLGQ
jgi:hypothetical protein